MGVAAVPVVAGAELAGIVGEVDITFGFSRKLALLLSPSFDHRFQAPKASPPKSKSTPRYMVVNTNFFAVLKTE